MPALGDYLDLTTSDAAQQWLRVLGRTPKARQEPFLPVETLLAFRCFFVIDHHSFGGSTSQLAPEPIRRLASLFLRSRASVLAKMANLDGSRRHRAAHELELFANLSTGPGRYTTLYTMTLTAARSVGIGAEELPDFLGLKSGPGLFSARTGGDRAARPGGQHRARATPTDTPGAGWRNHDRTGAGRPALASTDLP